MKKVARTNVRPEGETKYGTDVVMFGTKPILEIWELNDQDENLKDKPLMQFGLVKAEAILSHIDAIKDFVAKMRKA